MYKILNFCIFITDGFKNKNFDFIYHGEYTVRTVTNYSISKPSLDKIFQDDNSIKFFYDDYRWNSKTITLTGKLLLILFNISLLFIGGGCYHI